MNSNSEIDRRLSVHIDSGATLLVSRENGHESRRLSVGSVTDGRRTVQITAEGDSTVHLMSSDGHHFEFATLLGSHVCSWADSTRTWLRSAVAAVGGANVIETRNFFPSYPQRRVRDHGMSLTETDDRERGFSFGLTRFNAADSIEQTVMYVGDVDPIGATYFDTPRTTIDSLLGALCAAAESSKALARR